MSSRKSRAPTICLFSPDHFSSSRIHVSSMDTTLPPPIPSNINNFTLAGVIDAEYHIAMNAMGAVSVLLSLHLMYLIKFKTPLASRQYRIGLIVLQVSSTISIMVSSYNIHIFQIIIFTAMLPSIRHSLVLFIRSLTHSTVFCHVLYRATVYHIQSGHSLAYG